jgi:hypothetical protein
MEVSGELHIPAVLSHGEESRLHIEYKARWAEKPIWTRKRKSRYTPGIELPPFSL